VNPKSSFVIASSVGVVGIVKRKADVSIANADAGAKVVLLDESRGS